MDDKFRCPNCSSSQTRIRFKTNERVCNTCGYIYKIDEDDENESEE